MTKARANGEGSIYPYRNGYAAYVWVDTPDGKRRRKYVYGKTREIVHEKFLELHRQAKRGPITTSAPTLDAYLTYWYREVVTPELREKTAATYEMHIRLYISPYLGKKRLDKITIRDIRTWINRLRADCQCCVQGKDAARSPERQRCCAIGACCQHALSERAVRDARTVLRSALNNAVREELMTKNPVAMIKLRSQRKRRVEPWSVDEARRFLESAREEQDPLYATYVLILVLGLRRGEALGLSWSGVDLDFRTLLPSRGLQRIHGELVLGPLKTEGSEAMLPLPDICATALTLRKDAQRLDRSRHEEAWVNEAALVFTTRYGRPIDPRNFKRSFERRCERAGVRRIRVHDTRHTCGSLLAALDVHPRVAMQILRHSMIAVTMEIYTHVPSEMTREALRKLGASLSDPSS